MKSLLQVLALGLGKLALGILALCGVFFALPTEMNLLPHC